MTCGRAVKASRKCTECVTLVRVSPARVFVRIFNAGMAMSGPETLLKIEDERDIAEEIAVNLADIGLRAKRTSNGRTGLQKALPGSCTPDILHLMLNARSEELDPLAARPQDGRVEIGGLAMDFDTRKVTLEGKTIELSVNSHINRVRAKIEKDPG